jgi:hypothetical protein
MEIDTATSVSQIAQWSEQLRLLAAKIAVAKGRNCALMLVSAIDCGYDDAAAEIIMADALRVLPYGWPAGFAIELLNASSNHADFLRSME